MTQKTIFSKQFTNFFARLTVLGTAGFKITALIGNHRNFGAI